MTKEEFEAFKEEAKARGFTHVLTRGGALDIRDWYPYGVFTLNPGIEEVIGGFTWMDESHAYDYPAKDRNVGGCVTGIWTFVAPPVPRADELI